MKPNYYIGVVWFMVMGASLPYAASAQTDGSQRKIITTTTVGDVTTFRTSRTGRAHFQGSVGISTSDYFRGSYDNVEKDLDQIAYTTGLSMVFELPNSNQGAVTGLSLTLGTANNFASSDERPSLEDDGHWYESNWYAGLAGRLSSDWLGSITYTAYNIPVSDNEPTHEAAIAFQYVGKNLAGNLKPQLKLAAPFAGNRDNGFFASVSLTPQAKLNKGGTYPVTLKLPLEVGGGFDDYYGTSSGSAAYARLGVSASTPLASVPSRYGSWSVLGEIGVLARNDNLRAAEPAFADDAVVPSATLTLKLTY